MPTKKTKKRSLNKRTTKEHLSAQAGAEGAANRANKILGESPKAPEVMPFEATLAFAFRAVGGKKTAIEGARLVEADDVRFKRLVYAYDNLSPHDQETIRLEDLCLAAEITPDFFVGLVVPALWRRNVDIGKLIGGMAIAPVLEATAARAQGAFGMPDAKMIFDMNGMLPTSKGINIAIDNSKKTVNVGKGVEGINSPGMPTFEASVLQSTQAIRGDASVTQLGAQKQHLLPSAPEDIIESLEIIDAVLVEEESEYVPPVLDQQED